VNVILLEQGDGFLEPLAHRLLVVAGSDDFVLVGEFLEPAEESENVCPGAVVTGPVSSVDEHVSIREGWSVERSNASMEAVGVT